MGLMHDNREPQPQQTATREPLVDLNVQRPQSEETKIGLGPRRKQLSGAEAENSVAQPPPSAKAHRRSLTISETETSEPSSESQPQPEPQRPRLVEAPVTSEEQESGPKPGRSRGAISHPCDNPTELQNIIDPPRAISEEPAPPPSEKPPESQSHVDPAQVQQFVAQFVAELRAKQNFSMALVGGLAVAVIAAAVWALITTATNYPIGWMAVGVGLLVGGAVRMLGRGIDRSFGYLGATMSILGCLLGSLLSACTIVAGQGGLSLVAVLAHVCAKPALVPAAMIAAFRPLDLLFYGIALYEGYRFSFRQVTDVEITRALDRK